MSNKTIKHEVKLQKSVIILLGVLAFGVCANAFAPAFTIKDAMAELGYNDKLRIIHSGSISVR